MSSFRDTGDGDVKDRAQDEALWSSSSVPPSFERVATHEDVLILEMLQYLSYQAIMALVPGSGGSNTCSVRCSINFE